MHACSVPVLKVQLHAHASHTHATESYNQHRCTHLKGNIPGVWLEEDRQGRGVAQAWVAVGHIGTRPGANRTPPPPLDISPTPRGGAVTL